MDKQLSNTQKLTYSAMILAIALISMVFKGGGMLLVVFLTGAVVNACIIIDTRICGLVYGIILSIITPVASYFISPNPVHQTIPIVIPCIMAGNAIIALAVALIAKKSDRNYILPVSMIIGSIAKALFMGIVISLIILPNMLPAAMMKNLKTLQLSFSVIQLFAALVGSIYAYAVLGFVESRLNKDTSL